ncbi:unnamed protein product [Rhizopus microsporus]
MDNSDYEYEEETNYVLFNVGTTITDEYIDSVSKTQGGCRIIGLQEGKPYLQIGNQFFEGEIDDTIGTHLLFEIQESKRETTGLLPLLSSMRSKDDDKKKQKYNLTFACSTEKMVHFDSVTLEPKMDAEAINEAKMKEESQKRQKDEMDNIFM